MKKTRKSLIMSILSLVLCVAMLMGTTFAWFTDSVTSGKNEIVAGNLDVELKHYTSDASAAEAVKDATDLFDVDLWEPGVIVYENFVVSNEGTLALKFDLNMNIFDYNTTLVDNNVYSLADVLKVAILDEAFTGDRTAAQALAFDDSIEDFSKDGYLVAGESQTFAVVVYWDPSNDDNIYNVNNGRTTSDGNPLFIELGVKLLAAQKDFESDSFDNTYDEGLETHTHVYNVQPSGLWKCDSCSKFIENTDAPYIMVDVANKKAIPLTDANETALSAIGFTIIKTADKTTYKYENKSGTAKTVYIRMNGNDLVIDAPDDTIYRYGKADDIYILRVGGHSLYENGTVNDIVMLGSGHIEIADKAVVNDLSVAKYAAAADVKITLNSNENNVGTFAVYNEQKTIEVEKNGTTTTPEDMKSAGDPVAIINDEAARVGTILFSTLDEAIDAAESKGEKSAARVVNDQTLAEKAIVPEDTVLKVSAYTKLVVTDDKGVDLQANASLVNVGTILNDKDTEASPEGLSIAQDSVLVNYGGMFDDLHSNDDSVPAGGIFNENGQTISNDGKISNIGTIENEGTVKNSGELTNSGSITNKNNSEIENKGTVTNVGDIKNDGTITNDGSEAELNLQNGNTEGTGEIESQNGAQEIKEEDNKTARMGSTYYETLSAAIKAAEGTTGKTVRLLTDVTEDISIHGVTDFTLDLNNFTITGVVTLYDSNGITVKNGTVESSGIGFRIGEHQYTVVRIKDNSDSTSSYNCYGYHPLAPAQNVVIEDVTVSAKNVFSFTNINDDFTRDGQQQCYGIYLYKTGYTYREQYLEGGYWNPEKRAEVFTACSDIDSVSVSGCTFSYSNFVESVEKVDGTNPEPGEGYSIEKVIKLGVFTVDDSQSAHSDMGRFVKSGKYLVGRTKDNFEIVDTAPSSYYGKVGSTYFCYEGGANDAMEYAVYGETVYIEENATTEKTMGKGDTFDIVSSNGSVWYGAKAEKGYGILQTVDDNDPTITHFTTEIYVEASVWNGSTKLEDYGSLYEAFQNMTTSGYTIKLERDIVIEKANNNVNGYNYGLYFKGSSTFDLNGHTLVYKGSGAAVLSSAKSGDYFIKDSKGGGAIIATNGYCVEKIYTKTERTKIQSGTFISYTSNAVYVKDGKGNYYDIDDGTFVSLNNSEPVSGATKKSGTYIKTKVGSNQYLAITSAGEGIVNDIAVSEGISSITVPAGGKVLLPIISRIGYKLDGWFDANNKKVNDINGYGIYASAEEKTISTKWTAKTAFDIKLSESNATVTVKVDGADWDRTSSINPGSTVVVSVSYSQSNSRSCTINDEYGTSYSVDTEFTMPTADVTITASSSSGGCFTGDTLVSLADGSQKAVKDLTYGDMVLALDHETGETVPTAIASIVNHGFDNNKVISLQFSDGTTIDLVDSHGLFDLSENSYVEFTPVNYSDYIGDKFAKYNGKGYEEVELVSAGVSEQNIEAYTVITYKALNCITNDLLSITSCIHGTYNYFSFDENLKYNAEEMKADIEKYGLSDYSEWSATTRLDIYECFNFEYFNVAIAKGLAEKADYIGYVNWYYSLENNGQILPRN